MAAAFGGHPVELNDAPLALERLMPVPGIVRAPEGHERALDRRHFGDEIVEILARAQQAQAAARLLPGRVHVQEHGDDLAFRVGMDLAIAAAAASAHRSGGGSAREIDAEFLLEGCAKFV